uniref:Uncharacterized protein n=1 Tax=Onchocerca volvulus TaxID=6282 RepID=A0A8R1TUD4_ONCVO
MNKIIESMVNLPSFKGRETERQTFASVKRLAEVGEFGRLDSSIYLNFMLRFMMLSPPLSQISIQERICC